MQQHHAASCSILQNRAASCCIVQQHRAAASCSMWWRAQPECKAVVQTEIFVTSHVAQTFSMDIL